MNNVTVVGGGLSGLEMVILGALVLLCLAAAWKLYLVWTGRVSSDVSGLRLTDRAR